VRKRELFSILSREGDISERLTAARELARVANAADLPRIHQLYAIERVAWIRAALGSAIERLSGAVLDPHEADDDESTAETDATERVAKMLVHELRQRVGIVDLIASAEIANYDRSQTAAEISRLRELLSDLQDLGSSASSARVESFDLTLELHRIANDIVSEHESATGRRPIVDLAIKVPVVVRGDPGKVNFIINNALRNAFEATDAEPYSRRRITATWGTTNRDAWIAIRDFGPGLPEHVAALIRAGSTTKEHHYGIGLAIADVAAKSMGGSLSLRSADGGGALFEVRWPIA
jgi:signal transduction histidine kinase